MTKKPFGQTLQVPEINTIKKTDNNKKHETPKVTPKVQRVDVQTAKKNDRRQEEVKVTPKVEKVQRVGTNTANKTSGLTNPYSIHHRPNNTSSSINLYSINRLK